MADTWPPRELTRIRSDQQKWTAWYVGDADQLAGVYAGQSNSRVLGGGLVQRIARFFWSRPETDTTSANRLHVPLAADVAQAMADLLFGANPELEGASDATTARLEEYLDGGLTGVLREAAEWASVHGGAFLRPTYDRSISALPFLQVIRATDVVPTFRFGHLVGASIVTRLSDNGSRVLRYRETHGVDGLGIGWVRPELLDGTSSSLGRAIPLAEHAHTAGLANAVDAEGFLTDRTPGLGIIYLPNLRPQRTWADVPEGRDLGRSDFDGAEALLDALDEAYSAWMRDVRLAKSRIVVPEDYLETTGQGQGANFDADREAFSPLSIPQSESGASPITTYQAAMRSAEHLLNVTELTRVALRSMGLDPSAVGERAEGVVETATAVRSREGKSQKTRDAKARLAIPALRQALHKMLQIDSVVLKTPGIDPDFSAIKIDLPSTVQPTITELAQTAAMLRAAQAASTRSIVEIVNPTWDGDQVDDEVKLILAEQGSAADPAWV